MYRICAYRMNLINFLLPSTIRWPQIFGENIYLKNFELKYIDDLRKYLKDFEIFKYSFGAVSNFNQHEISEKYITQIIQNKGRTLSIFTKTGNKFIGIAHIFFINYFLKTYKFGIMIGDKNNINRGLGQDCVRTIIKHLFDAERANSIILETADFNVRAQKCFEKCGFKKIKDFYEFDTFIKQYANKILYRITRGDYGSSRP